MPSTRILIVEDEEDEALGIQSQIRSLGYPRPAIAATAETALAHFAESPPDLVLMDIRMGGNWDGIEAAAKIHAEFDVPVIFLTGYADAETLQRAKLTEPFGYLVKPVQTCELQATIEVALYKHKAEQKLRESEARYLDLLENAHDLIQSVAPDGTFLYVNRAWRETLGYKEDEIPELCLPDILTPKTRETYLKEFDHLLAGKEFEQIDADFVTKDGQVVSVEGSVNCSFKEEKAVATRGVFRDVTQRRKAEQALRESEQKFRTVFESAHDGLFLLEGGRYVDCNQAASDLFGFPRQEILGRRAIDFSPPFQPNGKDSRTESNQRIQKALQDEPQFFEWQHRKADGTLIDVDVSINAIEIDSKALLLASTRDITRRKQTEANLQRQNSELELLNRVSHALISTLNLDQVFPAIMEEVRRLLDVDSASVWLVDKERGGVLCRQAVGFRSEVLHGWHLEAGQGLADWSTRNGESLLVSDTREDPRYFRGVDERTGLEMRSVLTVPLRVNQKVIGVLQATDTQPGRFDQRDQRLLESLATPAAIAIDNARLYNQTQQDAITKAALLDEVNHRVKNNLTAIIGILYAEQRHHNNQSSDVCKELIDTLIRRVQGLATVHAMLSDTEWSPILLHEMVERVVKAALQSLPPGQRISVSVPPSEIRISSRQASSLALIINELVTNTIKYALPDRKEARIKVSIGCSPDYKVKLVFHDDGPGYPEEVLSFEQADVGLYLVRRLAQADLHGEVMLDNKDGAMATLFFYAEA